MITAVHVDRITAAATADTCSDIPFPSSKNTQDCRNPYHGRCTMSHVGVYSYMIMVCYESRDSRRVTHSLYSCMTARQNVEYPVRIDSRLKNQRCVNRQCRVTSLLALMARSLACPLRGQPPHRRRAPAALRAPHARSRPRPPSPPFPCRHRRDALRLAGLLAHLSAGLKGRLRSDALGQG